MRLIKYFNIIVLVISFQHIATADQVKYGPTPNKIMVDSSIEMLGSTNVSSEFNQAYEDNLVSPNAPQWMVKYHTIFVPGFLSSKQISLLGWDIFGPQIKILESIGASYEILDYGEDRLSVNAALLTKQILKAEKPVLLITHSHGSQIALEALLIDGQFSKQEKSPQKALTSLALNALCKSESVSDCQLALDLDTAPVVGRVKGLISLNGNVAGTPLVKDLLSGNLGVYGYVIEGYLKARKYISSEVNINVFEMSESVASQRLIDNQVILKKLTDTIPMISAASWYRSQSTCKVLRDETESGLGVSLICSANETTDKLTQRSFEYKGIISDAIVPLANAIIPGTDTVILENVSHFETVKKEASMGLGFDITTSSQALWKMLQKRIEENGSEIPLNH